MPATIANHSFIARALGAGILNAALDGRAHDVLVLLMTEHPDVMLTTHGAIFGLRLLAHIRASATDMYIPAGRIGQLDLSKGCFTGYEVFRLAAEDLARHGLASQISTHLRVRNQTVRQFLGERYGVTMGHREYWHDPRRTADEADLRDFLRMLRHAAVRVSKDNCAFHNRKLDGKA